MEKVIYSKFSNERAPRLSVKTEIVLKDTGEKYIKKSPMDPSAEQHVADLVKWNTMLQKMYSGSGWQICPCHQSEDGVIFDFVPGESMTHQLDAFLEAGQTERLFDTIEQCFSVIRKYNGRETFHVTEGFEKVFGIQQFLGTLQCGFCSNVDLIFDNLFLTPEGCTMIDYEWTFDFPIPIDYILFRALHYYVYTRQERAVLVDKGIFHLLKDAEAYLPVFENMEACFQKYIEGDRVPVRMLYRTMGRDSFDVIGMIRQHKALTGDRRIRIYKNRGQGFREDDVCLTQPQPDAQGHICVQIPIEPDVLMVRIDPVDRPCLLQVYRAEVNGETDVKDRLSVNGTWLSGQDIYFCQSYDPWMWLDTPDKNTSRLEIEYSCRPIEQQMAECMEAVCRELELARQENDRSMAQYGSLESQYHEMKARYEDACRLYQETAEQYAQLQQTVSWRITKPLRRLRQLSHKEK